MADDAKKSRSKQRKSRATGDATDREKHRNSKTKQIQGKSDSKSNLSSSSNSSSSEEPASDHQHNAKLSKPSKGSSSQINLNDPEVLKRLAKKAQAAGDASQGMDLILREINSLRDKNVEVRQLLSVYLHAKSNRYSFKASGSSTAADVVAFVRKQAKVPTGKAALCLYLLDVDGQEEEAIPPSDCVLDWTNDAPRHFALVVSDDMKGFGVPPIEYDTFLGSQ